MENNHNYWRQPTPSGREHTNGGKKERGEEQESRRSQRVRERDMMIELIQMLQELFPHFHRISINNQ